MPIEIENKPLVVSESEFNPAVSQSGSYANWHFGVADNPPLRANVETIGVLTFAEGTQIPDSDYEFEQCVVAELRTTADGFVIRCYSIDEEAYGHTYKEAYLDFLTSIRDSYRSLIQREEKLSKQDSEILNELRALLQRH